MRGSCGLKCVALFCLLLLLCSHAMAGVELIRLAGGIVDQALFIVDLPDLGGSAKLRAGGIAVGSLIGFDGD